MTKVRDSELRLVTVIQEARDMIASIELAKKELKRVSDDLPKSARTEKAEVERLIKVASEKQKEIRAELHTAHQAVGQIESHKLWKEAVAALFGYEGLQRCYEYMQESRKEVA